MSERRSGHGTPAERVLEAVLREDAELTIPDSADLWPAIGRQARKEASASSLSEPSPARPPERPLVRRPRSARLGWVTVTLLALAAAGGGALAAGGIEDALDRVFGETAPNVQGTPVAEEQSRGDLKVTIHRVYADSSYVAVGYSVEGLKELRRRWPNTSSYMNLTNPEIAGGEAEGSGEYAQVEGRWSEGVEGARVAVPPKGSEVGTVMFEAPQRLEAGEEHRLRAEVYFVGQTGRVLKNGALETERVGRPFFFDLEVPITRAPVIEVDQTVEASGVPITLTEVVNSPVKTSAYLCFEPPERRYDWPLVKTRLFEQARMADVPVYHTEDGGGASRDGCATYRFDESLYSDPGWHSLTITELHAGDPKPPYEPIEGPWRFRFEVPEP